MICSNNKENGEHMLTKQEILKTAMKQSAIDCSCSETDFCKETAVVVESKASDEASRYMKLPHICAMFSYGSNVVASCRRDLIPEVEAFLNGQERAYRSFEPMAIYELNRILEKADARVQWIHLCYLPDPEQIFSLNLPCAYETRMLYQKDFADLYLPEWGNALCADRKELDMLGVGAYDGDRLVGMAACSADCVDMWQIGIDVLPEYRRKGIASALTNQLARAIFEHGKVPFYASAWSNIRSMRNGLKSGFSPAWAALTAVSKEKPEEK